jgi:hypothetical protein
VAQPQCHNCGASLTPDDVFCGICGAAATARARSAPPSAQVRTASPENPSFQPVPAQPAPARRQVWPDEPSYPAPQPSYPAPQPSYPAPQPSYPAQDRAARRHARAAEELAPDEFFTHAPSQPSGPLSNATRYLCAAAYLNPAFANMVIGELLASHRAVVPSLGIDLVPIIRHCLNARRAQILRDVLLTVFLLAGLLFATTSIIGILIIAFVFGLVLPGVDWERHSIGLKVLTGVAIAFVVALFIFFVLLQPIFDLASRSPSEFGLVAGVGGKTGIALLIFLGLVGTTLFGYSYSMFKTFSEQLRPGARAGNFQPAAPHAEARIDQVAAAQYGNMAIYAGENPFIGTGVRGKSWSIAIELDHAQPSSQGRERRTPKSRGYVAIDPVELHQAIRARLLKLRDEDLPGNERISSLTVHDHVVGDGHCRWDSPIVDSVGAMPYSEATPEAIDALIRHPAAGLRYYQRVCVSAEGQAVWTRQREVIGSTDQEIAASAFIYIAVEGRMFYLEFVPATLPPVLSRYHLIDRLPKITSGRFMTKASLHAASTAFQDMIRAPFGVVGTIWRTISERRAFQEEAVAAKDYVFADVGARISVREIGSASSPRTFLQRLDAAKYTKIIERLVTDTVFDFLVDKGVDTSAYQESASAVINTNYNIAGNVGALATGLHGQAEVHSHVAAAATGPKS